MTERELAAAVAAARRQADDAANDGAATRLRIRETLATQAARRTRGTTIVAGLLATIFGSTAFAYYSDWRPQLAVSSPAEVPPAPAPAVERDPEEAPRPAARAIVRESVPEVVMTVERPAVRVVATSEPHVAAVPEIPAAPDPELAAYRVAHEAHFRGHGPAAALAAWDAYLARYPAGTFAIDARWNRALLLIKLGRHADARTALEPFANAPAGSYRQAEAAKLLAALPRP